jgi:hypothetical protein
MLPVFRPRFGRSVLQREDLVAGTPQWSILYRRAAVVGHTVRDRIDGGTDGEARPLNARSGCGTNAGDVRSL